jgi:hypothetical protein
LAKTYYFQSWENTRIFDFGGTPKMWLINELINELISENVFAPVTLINILLGTGHIQATNEYNN